MLNYFLKFLISFFQSHCHTIPNYNQGVKVMVSPLYHPPHQQSTTWSTQGVPCSHTSWKTLWSSLKDVMFKANGARPEHSASPECQRKDVRPSSSSRVQEVDCSCTVKYHKVNGIPDAVPYGFSLGSKLIITLCTFVGRGNRETMVAGVHQETTSRQGCHMLISSSCSCTPPRHHCLSRKGRRMRTGPGGRAGQARKPDL